MTQCFLKYGQVTRRRRNHIAQAGSGRPTSFPSFNDRILRHAAAASASCVTMTSVGADLTVDALRGGRGSRRRSSVSRLPVGLVGEQHAQAMTRARAMATRWHSPPDSSVRQVVGPLAEADQLEEPPRVTARASALDRRWSRIGSATLSKAVSVGSRLKNWKMNPILSRRTRVSASSPKPGELGAVEPDRARARLIEAAQQVKERRFSRSRRAPSPRPARPRRR